MISLSWSFVFIFFSLFIFIFRVVLACLDVSMVTAHHCCAAVLVVYYSCLVWGHILQRPTCSLYICTNDSRGKWWLLLLLCGGLCAKYYFIKWMHNFFWTKEAVYGQAVNLSSLQRWVRLAICRSFVQRKVMRSVFRLANLIGQFWQMESHLKWN